MPTKEELDQTALDYGVLLAGIKEKTLERNKLNEDIEQLAQKRTMLNEEIAKAKEANDRVRVELIDQENRLAEARKAKADELLNERQIVEAQRQANDKQARQNNETADAIKLRDDNLTSREKALGVAQKALDARVKKVNDDSIAVDDAKRDLEARERQLATGKRDLEDQQKVVDKRLRDAMTAESNGKAAMETARIETKRAQEDRLKEQSHMLEAQQWSEKRQKAERDLRVLIPVFSEIRDFIKGHISTPGAIDLYIRQKHPEIAQFSEYDTAK